MATRATGENMPDYVVDTVSADALAPRGDKVSAGIVMTKFVSRIYCLYKRDRYSNGKRLNIFGSAKSVSKSLITEINLKGYHVYFDIITASADAWASLSAKAFAGTVMATLGCRVYPGLTFGGLILGGDIENLSSHSQDTK